MEKEKFIKFVEDLAEPNLVDDLEGFEFADDCRKAVISIFNSFVSEYGYNYFNLEDFKEMGSLDDELSSWGATDIIRAVPRYNDFNIFVDYFYFDNKGLLRSCTAFEALQMISQYADLYDLYEFYEKNSEKFQDFKEVLGSIPEYGLTE